mmetsp:Transcript_37042/g.89935  ORF Transcript_37042/g.89935 Transcript_37042/m.89935 type:complete len:228 (-) Transcript_37042:421-1104(-)
MVEDVVPKREKGPAGCPRVPPGELVAPPDRPLYPLGKQVVGGAALLVRLNVPSQGGRVLALDQHSVEANRRAQGEPVGSVRVGLTDQVLYGEHGVWAQHLVVLHHVHVPRPRPGGHPQRVGEVLRLPLDIGQGMPPARGLCVALGKRQGRATPQLPGRVVKVGMSTLVVVYDLHVYTAVQRIPGLLWHLLQQRLDNWPQVRRPPADRWYHHHQPHTLWLPGGATGGR